MDTVPKWTAISGTANTMAPTEAENHAARACSTPAKGPSPRDAVSASCRRSEKHRMPAMQAKLSCRLTLAAAKGLASNSRASAADREVSVSFSRRTRGAISSSVCITPARTAEGVEPDTIEAVSAVGVVDPVEKRRAVK